MSTRIGLLTFAPRIRETADFGSGAKIISLEKTGFAGRNVAVEFRYDGLGDVGPSRASRSPDGDTVVLTFDPPITPPGDSLFPAVLTDTTESAATGRITIRVITPDATILSTTINETEVPK